MRRYPQRGFSLASCSTSARISSGTGGRPGAFGYVHFLPVGLEYTNAAATWCFPNGHWKSSGDLILVREAAEDLLSADPVLGEADPGRPGVSVSRWQLGQGAVRPGAVVVEQVFGQYPAQVLLVDYQQPAGELAPQGADHPFADGVRLGRLRRAAEDSGAVCVGHGAEGPGELPCTVPGQELDRNCALAQVHQEFTCCLRRPRAAGVRGDVGQVISDRRCKFRELSGWVRVGPTQVARSGCQDVVPY